MRGMAFFLFLLDVGILRMTAKIASFPSLPTPLWPNESLQDLLDLARAKYSVDFEPVMVGGITLQVLQITDMKERLDRAIAENALADALNTLPLWAKVWPSSVMLGHLLSNAPAMKHGTLEIGAGCGLAGLAAAAFGLGPVCISDINEDALLFARINILRNGLQDRAEVRRVDIAQDNLKQRFSLILGAEVLYLDHLYRPLVKFIKRHLAPADAAQTDNAVPQALLASDHRRKAAPFLKKAEKEFAVSRKQVGIREKTDSDDSRAERHLIDIIRLTAHS